jgi:myo-inositol 2-dehydrogenase/D-chiro-inositol 1-dehydrogenase
VIPRVAVLGCGRIGNIHATNVAQSARAELAAVVDASPHAADTLAQRLRTEVGSIDQTLSRGTVDAVIIATPTDTHADLIEASVAAGIAVLCEKPVDLSSARIRSCISQTSSSRVPVMIGFNRRFDPDFSELRRRLAGGEIGRPEILTVLSRDPAPPPISYIERSGGLFRDMMIHDLDMVRFLLGEEPRDVYAAGSVMVDLAIGRAGDVDTASVTLKTASGCIAQISCSRRATYGFDNRIEVHGAEGMLSVGNMRTSNVAAGRAVGFSYPRNVDFFPQRYRASYVNELEAFLDAVEGRAVASPTLSDGLAAQILADAATESARTGQPVSLSVI